MRKRYWLSTLLLAYLGSAQITRAQTLLGAAPYKQNFDGLATQNYGGTAGAVHCTNGRLDSPSEVYTQASFPTINFTYSPTTTFTANDGSNSVSDYYHFGYAGDGDRAFGGIGGTTFNYDGVGYVGIRLKNNTGTTIVNLEVQYAMEQWYNSGRQDAAKVSVAYQTGTTVTSLLTGTWTDVAALGVNAPSTATVISNRDGNSAANRRVASTTIMGLNLVAGQEIMLRWAYALSSNTNGNGLSIDDVVVTPETNIFYSNATGKLDALSTWNSSPDGTGIAPTDFGAANQIFYVMSAAPSTPSPVSTDAVDRLTGTWTVNGTNSKIVVGTASAPAAMQVASGKNVKGTIDVSPGSYFYNRHTNTDIGFTLGTLASTSTVEYNSNGTAHAVQPVQYGNLYVSGTNTSRATNAKKLTANTVVTGNLILAAGSDLELGDYNLTVLGSQNISGYSATSYVVTNGAGRLRVQVPRASSSSAGTVVAFPVGPTHTVYNPLTLQQTFLSGTNTNSDDVFEVRVIDNVYKNYNSTTYAPNTEAPVTTEVVKKTWFVSKEVPTNASSVTMTAQWGTADEAGPTGGSFTTAQRAKAHINHYTEGAWDTYLTEMGSTTSSSPYVAKRSGITSFSPFGVSSRADGTLPVVLTAFAAQRSGAAVRCTWATASELHSRSFSVERSLDGSSFETLGEVAAAGLSTTARSYSFLDAQAVATTAYYRLRQNDLNGQVAYSTVLAVAGTESVATAAPNPSTGLVAVSARDIMGLEVLNALGQSVLTQQSAVPVQALAVDLGAQPAGVYLVRLHTAHGTQVVRVVKN